MADELPTTRTNVDFKFERSRGIVWVCDMASSSANLNDDSTVDALEEFIPRLYWLGLQIVESAGGIFVKWTGDGFLAWFEMPLERDLGKRLTVIFNALWHLSAMINVTQLGVKAPRKFKVRHGITFEPDAKLIRVRHEDGHESLDLIGRSVVLAFRLSGMSAKFPSIVTQAKIFKAYSGFSGEMGFRKRSITKEERLKYFKGQRMGTDSIYATADRISRFKTFESAAKNLQKAINTLEEPKGQDYLLNPFIDSITGRFSSGPDWTAEVMVAYARYIKDDLLGNIKKLVPDLEERAQSTRQS
ncbi:MAG: hypothetical protein IH872_11255 [Chloroflexi bacterium]|nr:hypothetical protein [Chloroflexota bacterium]